MKVEDYFREWTGTRPNLNIAFHEAGIEVMAFAESYHKAKMQANGAVSDVNIAESKLSCGYCEEHKPLKYCQECWDKLEQFKQSY